MEEPIPEGDGASSADKPTPKAHETSSTPDSTASNAEPPQKRLRSNEFWLAAIGMAGTLLAAIAGGVATYFTGVEHDNHETSSAQTSFSEATQTAQTSFRRTQQLAAYTGFVDSYEDMWAALDAKLDAILRRYPYSQTTNSPLVAKADVETSLTNFDHAQNLVTLFGGTTVQNEANNMYVVLRGIRDEIDTWELMHPVPDISPCLEVARFANHVGFDDLNQLNAAEDRFNGAAREDLGLPSHPPTSPSPPPPLFSC